MEESEKTIKDVAADWGETLDKEIEWYQSPDREADEQVRAVLSVKAKEIRPAELLFRETNAILLVVLFAENDADGKALPRLFELSESASEEYRAIRSSSTSFGEMFRKGLIQ